MLLKSIKTINIKINKLIYHKILINYDSNLTNQSNNQKFKNIPLDYTIINQLDNLQLGYLPKRRLRIKYARKYDNLEKNEVFIKERRNNKIIPLLFRKIGSKLVDLEDLKDIHRPLYRFDCNPPEVAIIGRSNVGKSSLLNALLGFNSSYVQKSNTSTKPGETKCIHLYGVRMKHLPGISQSNSIYDNIKTNQTIRSMSLVFADMPGYGFAFANDENKEKINILTKNYLLFRKNLKIVLLLVDSRHGIKYNDLLFFKSLLDDNKNIENVTDATIDNVIDKPIDNTANKPKITWKLQIIFTKCDLLPRNDVARRMSQLSDQLNDYFKDYDLVTSILPTSAYEHKGIIELQKNLSQLVDHEDLKNYTVDKSLGSWIDNQKSGDNIGAKTINNMNRKSHDKSSSKFTNKIDDQIEISNDSKKAANKLNNRKDSNTDKSNYKSNDISVQTVGKLDSKTITKSNNLKTTKIYNNVDNSFDTKVNSKVDKKIDNNIYDKLNKINTKSSTITSNQKSNQSNNKISFHELGQNNRQNLVINQKPIENEINEEKYQNFFSPINDRVKKMKFQRVTSNRNRSVSQRKVKYNKSNSKEDDKVEKRSGSHDNDNVDSKIERKINNKVDRKVDSKTNRIQKPRYFDFTKSRPI